MKNKLAKIVAVLTVAGLMSAGSVVYAASAGDPPSDEGDKSEQVQRRLARLNLTPEQREKFMELLESQAEGNKAMEEQLATKKQELDAVIVDPGAIRSDADHLIDEMSTLHKEKLSRWADRNFATKKILTPEQFAKMREIEKERIQQGPVQN